MTKRKLKAVKANSKLASEHLEVRLYPHLKHKAKCQPFTKE